MRMIEAYLIDQNPADARYTMNRVGVVQTLTARCGTGGGNVPMILFYNDRRKADYHEVVDGIAPTVVAKYGTGGVIPR